MSTVDRWQVCIIHNFAFYVVFDQWVCLVLRAMQQLLYGPWHLLSMFSIIFYHYW
ncbi:hypothetical protein F5I97DRAFT_1851116 [Phlebopus sp. FC_14]|nr:hypothetical protein F5I97DRAFT_1851116 [Phlebopus sp. FC_14]